MRNQLLFSMQEPFTGGIIRDENLLKELFRDNYQDALAFENEIKESAKNGNIQYFGYGVPFVVSGFFLKYQQPGADKLHFISTDGTKTWMYRKDFENQIKAGDFNGVPMHPGHTRYPEDPNDFKQPFGSVLNSVTKNEGGYGYYYILPSEFKLRMDIAASRSVGFERAPLRDLSSQFVAQEYNPDKNQIKKIKVTSIDLVYKKLAAFPGSGFEFVYANQHKQEEETMDREEVLKTITLEELSTNEHTKPLVAKLQEQARDGYVKRGEIKKVVESDSAVREEIVKCQTVIDAVQAADKLLTEKIKSFKEQGEAWLKGQGIPEERAKKIVEDQGKELEHDVIKLQNWHKRMNELGINFKNQGISEDDEKNTEKNNGEKQKNNDVANMSMQF